MGLRSTLCQMAAAWCCCFPPGCWRGFLLADVLSGLSGFLFQSFFWSSKACLKIRRAHAEGRHAEKSAKLNGRVYFTALTMFLFGVFLFVFQTNVAMFVAGKGLGDASTSGLINTSMSAAGMLTGILFGKMQRVRKVGDFRYLLLVGGLGAGYRFARSSLKAGTMAALTG